jgi:hypothetical protein
MFSRPRPRYGSLGAETTGFFHVCLTDKLYAVTILSEKLTVRTDSQEIPRLLRNPKFHCRVHASPSQVPEPEESTQHPQPYFVRPVWIFSSYLQLGLLIGKFTRIEDRASWKATRPTAVDKVENIKMENAKRENCGYFKYSIGKSAVNKE